MMKHAETSRNRKRFIIFYEVQLRRAQSVEPIHNGTLLGAQILYWNKTYFQEAPFLFNEQIKNNRS